MRKQTDSDDNKEKKSGEAKRAATRRSEPRSQAGSQSSVACSSFTLPISSHGGINTNQWESLKGICGIDWFQLAACIEWDKSKAESWFDRLREVKEIAQEQRRPKSLTIGPDIICVTSSGTGGGNDAYKEILITWKNVQVGLSERSDPTRLLSNASLQVSGAPCLITGAGVAWEFFVRLVKNLGGEITDEWLRRLDICIDVPNLNFSDTLYPMLLNQQVVTRSRNTQFSLNCDNATGYSVGRSNRLRVLIYNKLHDALINHDPVYIAAMIQRRWGGLPESATRFEWQMGRAYLKQFGLDSAKETMRRMPDLFAKLTDERGGAFRITSTRPDRENKHQSRATTHPIWERVVDIGLRKIGDSTQPLKRLDRSQLNEANAIVQIIGYATSIADRRQAMCETKADVLRIVEETMKNHQVEDTVVLNSFMKKAKQSGTWQEIISFPGKEAA